MILLTFDYLKISKRISKISLKRSNIYKENKISFVKLLKTKEKTTLLINYY
jgi:hypothetical protein